MKRTWRSSTSPLSVSGREGCCGEVRSLTVSMTSKWRSSAVLVLRVMPSSMPMPSTGPAMTAAIAK
ncbi:hypothetical protein [Arthrobacter sp. JCM 19049]|uniref:hypothetical protein n=1 Tax=Arthrobacter sp. JCM 19049 TaxID=1460643 RepID=UPI0006D20294|nr:hypothetical protein [Arthrobacter sp. JCM 19049]